MQIGRLVLYHPIYGPTKYTVHIVYDFLWWYRIEAIEMMELPRNRRLSQGQRAWVPKSAIRLIR